MWIQNSALKAKRPFPRASYLTKCSIWTETLHPGNQYVGWAWTKKTPFVRVPFRMDPRMWLKGLCLKNQHLA